jgi:glycosyltransferase involved in cell wall biosynthesis
MSKLLAYMETPFIETGSGQVSKHLLPVLHEFFDHIHLVAINQFQEPALLPDWLTITCTSGEDHAATRESKEAIKAGGYDAIFLSTDLNRIAAFEEELKDVQVPIVMYALMDTHVWQSQFWQIMDRATIPVLPSKWAVRQALQLRPHLADRLQAIYHGCEPDVFFPLSPEERRKARKEFFGIEDDNRFLALNCNRNQVRKDLPRTMAAFHLFHLEHPDSCLYLHSRRIDLGGDLASQALYIGLDLWKHPAEVVFAPDSYFAASGVPRTDLNRIYNCADVFVTTTTGEGWGLTTSEAMAAGVPVIGPDNTTFPEILGKWDTANSGWNFADRGILVNSGGPDLWVTFFTISDVPRELVSTTGMRAAIEEVYNHREAAKERAVQARTWTKEHTWSQIQNQWRAVWKAIDLSPWTSELSYEQPVMAD